MDSRKRSNAFDPLFHGKRARRIQTNGTAENADENIGRRFDNVEGRLESVMNTLYHHQQQLNAHDNDIHDLKSATEKHTDLLSKLSDSVTDGFIDMKSTFQRLLQDKTTESSRKLYV